MAKQRLSMKLMWKLLYEFQETEEYNDATMGDFLNFAEETLKATEARKNKDV